ncbi:MAG: FtsX-like permease family protein [Longimicrobiales bacterium]
MHGFRPLLALRLAARGLRRDAVTTGLAVSILALGLALPATFFSLLVGAIRPLPVPDGHEIVRVDARLPSAGGRALAVTPDDLDVLRGAAGLEGLAGSRTFAGILVDPDRAASRVAGGVLTPDALDLLGVEPLLGRVPSADEAASTVLLGQEIFEDVFDSDPDVLGRVVQIDGRARTVVAVMPSHFGFPLNQNLWVLTDPAEPLPLELVGRLADGGATQALEAELTARWRRRDALRDPADAGGVVTVESYTGSRGESGEGMAFLGLVLVALALLLIACANVANLLLVRATERVRALGIQAALGAGRAQVGGQLFLEALLVALAGGVVGLTLAWIAVDVIQARLAGHFGYYWMRMAVDGPVVVFTSVLVVGTALVAGTLPAVRVLRVDVHRVLKEEGAGAAVGGGGAWSRTFVTVQLALSCAALVAAGLTGRAMVRGGDYGRGVPAEEILVASLELGTAPDRPVADAAAALEAALGNLPGASAAAVAVAAAGYFEASAVLEIDGRQYPRWEDHPYGMWNGVTAAYFDVMDLELRAGRMFGPADHGDGPRVALASEAFVRRHFDGSDPLGRRVRLIHPGRDTTEWHTVVGVVEDAVLSSTERARNDRLYLPLGQSGRTDVMGLVRTPGGIAEVADLASGVRTAVSGVDPGIPVWGVRALDDAHDYIVRIPRALAGIALGGGVAGLLVSAVGLYGLLSFRVRQRRRELGVRLALGADGRRLAREVLVVALRQILPALTVGLVVAWVAAPALQVMLMGTEPRSAGVFLVVAAAFVTVGMGAALRPALRAAAVDPATTLRGE